MAAVDPSEPFVEVCRSRVGGADVRVGRAEELPFGGDEFDAVLAQLVVQRLSDFWSSFSRGVGGSSAYWESLDEDRRSTLREEVWRRLGCPEAAFRLPARAWYAHGLALV